MMESHSKKIRRSVKTTRRREDRLSSLPEHILIDILSLLPLKSAIVTSLLSRRWRHLWTQITSFIVIDHSYLYDSIKFLAYDEKFKQLTSPSIISLEIHLSSYSFLSKRIESIINSWLIQVCARNVERIKVSIQSEWEPPPCVFQAKSLVELDLQGLRVLNLPNVTELPNLKRLRICYTVAASPFTSFANFISFCSLLEDLYFEFDLGGTDLFSDVDIRAPNLKRLDMNLYHYFQGVFVIDAPNLEFLTVRSPTKFRFVQVPKAIRVTQLRHCKGAYILKSISQCVRSLRLEHVPFLPRLRFSYLACLNVVDFEPKELNKLRRFLEFCPVLEVIRLKINLRYCRTCHWRWINWRLWRIAQFQTNTKKIEIELEKGGNVLKHKIRVVKMVKYLVRSVNKDLKQLTLRVSKYDCQTTSFSTLGNNLVNCLAKVKRLSNYEMDSSNTAYWSFVAWF